MATRRAGTAAQRRSATSAARSGRKGTDVAGLRRQEEDLRASCTDGTWTSLAKASWWLPLLPPLPWPGGQPGPTGIPWPGRETAVVPPEEPPECRLETGLMR